MPKLDRSRILKPSALRLIDAAERLIGEQGFDGVSLQEIAAAAGHANKFAVQYYFGSKIGLVNAVFENRLPVIDARRQQLFDALEGRGEITIRDLLFVFFRPVVDQVDGRGRHAFARFADQIRHLPEARAFWTGAAQLGGRVHAMLRERSPHLSSEDFDIRFSLAIDVFTGAMRLLDLSGAPTPANSAATQDAARLLAHALDMAQAGFTSPVQTDDALLAPPTAGTSPGV